MDHQIETKEGDDESKDTHWPRRRDGGKWPSLYEECKVMLATSTFMYAVADLRAQIRKGLVDPSIADPFMELPADSSTLRPIIRENKDFFNKLLKGGETPEGDEDSDDRNYPYVDLVLRDEPMHELTILEMHDESPQLEVVYSIAVNHSRQWIEIAFRGSATLRDFIADVDPRLEWFPNPVESIPGHPQEKTIGIHTGFSEYLHGREKGLRSGKSQQIRDSVLALQEKYPHYRCYLTGHSLGGALATLVAFELATDKDIAKPVNCVSVASPKVGNVGFLYAFQALEKMGHIRCVRLVNQYDLIPYLPNRFCWCMDFCCCCLLWFCTPFQHGRFWQVGAKILLLSGDDKTCEITYERAVLNYREQWGNEMSQRNRVCCFFTRIFATGAVGRGDGDFLRNHSCKEYFQRLDAAKEELETTQLEILYKRQARSSINLIHKSQLPVMVATDEKP